MSDPNDGGYYAIKGFLYQFDKTLIEILKNPEITVGIEQRQDVAYQDFVIQVKHKETQTYQHNKVREPIRKLIDMFKADQNLKFCLYCHFKDCTPRDWKLTLTELDTILGNEVGNYDTSLRERFADGFYIRFSEDFETQFAEVIELIKSVFRLGDKNKAYIYHSILQSRLLEISRKTRAERLISKRDLDNFVGAAEKTIFYTSYQKYLDEDRYVQLVKKEYFTDRTLNKEEFERLFLIACDEEVNCVDLRKIVSLLIRKYHRPNKSPQPYLCLTGLDNRVLTELKQELIDLNILFYDGTYFHGDRFRLDSLIKKNLRDDHTKIKIVNYENLEEVLSNKRFHEVFQFYLELPERIEITTSHTKIEITGTKQVLRILA